MSSDYQQALTRLVEKARLLARRYEIVEGERDEALEKISQLQADIDKRDAEIARLKTEMENLVVVKTAFPSREAMAESRKYLTGLMREIDQCIKDLTT